MAYSYLRHTYAGVNVFAVNFTLGYISQDQVKAQVNDEVDGLGDPVYRTITWLTEGTIAISGSLVNGDQVLLTRTVDKEDLTHNYADGEIITEENLDQSFKQAIMAVHEVLDGRFGVIQTEIDMGTNRITNLGNAIGAQDAVTLNQLEDYTGNAPAYAAAAANSASQASASAVQADNFKDLAEAARDAAAISVDEAQDILDAFNTVIITPFQFGALGDGTTDDYVALQAWLNSGAATVATEGPKTSLFCPAGFKFRIRTGLIVAGPIDIDMGSFLYFDPVSSTNKSALTINQTDPTSRNMGARMRFAGLVHVTGNTGTVTSINATGAIGVNVKNMQFGTLQVDNVRQFTKYGIYLNGSNDTYANQHIQDNTFRFGLGAFNGRGLFINSVSASLGAVQVNDIYVQNYFANYENIRIDDVNSNNNNLIINAMDANAPGGKGFVCNGSYNSILNTYCNTDIEFGATAYSNTFTTTITPDVYGVVTDAGVHNRIITGSTGVANPCTPSGRLTLVTGAPVQKTDVLGATTIYYAPYNGAVVPIWNGASFDAVAFSQLSNLTAQSSTGKAGPAVVANNSNYDLFVWNDIGVPRLTRGPLWTSDTARGTGAGTTELEMVKGILVNKVAITNGPAAREGTYVGTVRSNGTASIDFNFGGLGVGGVLTRGCVWNAYNRVRTVFGVGDTTDNYSYATATYRAANASNNMRVSFVTGLQEDDIVAQYSQQVATGVATGFPNIGMGIDSTTVLSGFPGTWLSAPASPSLNARLRTGALGFHFIQAIEKTMDGANVTWSGDGGSPTNYQNGLTVELMM